MAVASFGAEESLIGIGEHKILNTHLIDLRTTPPDVFKDLSDTDWSKVGWNDVGRPYKVENYSSVRTDWEHSHGEEMPVRDQWQYFNRYFHDMFVTDVPAKRKEVQQKFWSALGKVDTSEIAEAFQEFIQVQIWNRIHRTKDAVWDPRGKRALFEGLDVKNPKILFLGAADGYEAMQLMAMYPGGHAVLVDYDDFCEEERFGNFPEAYPFLGHNPATGGHKVYYREDFDITFEVKDLRDIDYAPDFDIVLSVGLIEHFPDEHKPHAIEYHRRFLKPGGYAIVTTPRKQLQSQLYYRIMGEVMNFGYRELMTCEQMGLYMYENGFDILRSGYIKAHNGLIAQPR